MVVTSFECPKILIIDQGTHFVNQLIEELTYELTDKTSFKLVYGQEAFMPMEYIVPSLRVVAIT